MDYETIQLKRGQSAKPHQCGSCKFFEHPKKPIVRTIHGGPIMEEVETWIGRCNWNPPPWLIDCLKLKTGALVRDVNDTDTCDLYRTSRAEFVREDRWRVPQDTRE